MRDPTNPREWLRRALSNLARATHRPDDREVLLADLCFDAQQAAEKALKAVLVLDAIVFPKTHSLPELIDLLVQGGHDVSNEVRAAAGLTRHAVASRYPSFVEDVGTAEWGEAAKQAEVVVRWAADRVMSEVNAFVDLVRRMPDSQVRERSLAKVICRTLSVEWTLRWLGSQGRVTSQIDLRAARIAKESALRDLCGAAGPGERNLWLALDGRPSRHAANLIYSFTGGGELRTDGAITGDPSLCLPADWRVFVIIESDDLDFLSDGGDGTLSRSMVHELTAGHRQVV
jgi:HEPN domain-containing protein